VEKKSETLFSKVIKFAEFFVINFIKIGMFFVCVAAGVGLLVGIVYFLVNGVFSPFSIFFVLFLIVVIGYTVVDYRGEIKNNEKKHVV